MSTTVTAPRRTAEELRGSRELLVNLTLRRRLALPLEDKHIEEAIGLVAHDYSQLTAESQAFLRRVAGSDGVVVPAAGEVQLMARLIASQMLTLLTTPVVYVYLDRLRRRRDERFLSRPSGGQGQVQPA